MTVLLAISWQPPLSGKSQTTVVTSVASARYLDKLLGAKNHSVFSTLCANVYLVIKHQPTIYYKKIPHTGDKASLDRCG